MLPTILKTAISAAVYSFVFYAKKYKKDEEFNPIKLVSTIIVGVAVGVVLVMAGDPLSQEAIETQLLAYAGIVGLVESVLKAIYRQMKV